MLQQNQNVLAAKDDELRQNVQAFQEEINNLRDENEELRNKVHDYENLLGDKGKLVEELNKDMDIIRQEYMNLEYNYKTLIGEHAQLKTTFNSVEEMRLKQEIELNEMIHKYNKCDDELRAAHEAISSTQREKSDLIGKTEAISSQVKRVK